MYFQTNTHYFQIFYTTECNNTADSITFRLNTKCFEFQSIFPIHYFYFQSIMCVLYIFRMVNAYSSLSSLFLVRVCSLFTVPIGRRPGFIFSPIYVLLDTQLFLEQCVYFQIIYFQIQIQFQIHIYFQFGFLAIRSKLFQEKGWILGCFFLLYRKIKRYDKGKHIL